MPDWEVLLQWVDEVNMRDVSACPKRKQEICSTNAQSRADAVPTITPSSSEYAQQHPLQDDVVEAQAGGDVDDDDDNAHD